ncbi:MAG: hypothetical protein JXM70_29310 [Pirellulales bacterium]|nr:hypothetical protein [Pirellulales bacterium]
MKNYIRNIVAIAIAFVLLCIPMTVIRLSYEIAFVGASPAIEQLRSDLTDIAGIASEDVVGQATAWNQKIRSMQAYNGMWWGDPFIPDQWDSVVELPIPRTNMISESRKYDAA